MIKYDYDILFIGGVYENGKEQEYLEKTKSGGIQNAVNIHQWNFIYGLDYNNMTPVKILSARYVNNYPDYKDIYVQENKWEHTQGAQDENIGFLNIKILKNIDRKRKLKKKAIQWAKEDSNRQKIIVCYYPSIPQLNATIRAKERNPEIKTILIIPDIPQYMNLRKGKSKIRETFEKEVERISIKLIKKFDKYVVLTKFMPKKLGIDEKSCIVIEGISQEKDIKPNNNQENNEASKTKKVVYAGSLHEKYGMRDYIEAIKRIERKDIEFYIFGSGEMEEEIIELSKKDNRIKFMGYCSNDIVHKYQKEADLLINPRKNDEEFVKYSFPSKLIEYMASGVPVLTTKLVSIPKEYDEYLFYMENSAPETIHNKIEEILNEDEKIIKKKAYEADLFIQREKNNRVQCQKILSML